MKLDSVAVNHQQAAADPKDRISGCSSALPEGLWEEKGRLNFLSSESLAGGVLGAKRAFESPVLSHVLPRGIGWPAALLGAAWLGRVSELFDAGP